MDKDPAEIRREIEETRERMGDTVEALAYKADVPARAKDAMHDRVDSIKHAVSDAVDATQAALGGVADSVQAKVGGAVGEAQPHVADVRDSVGSAVSNLSASARDTADQVRDKLPSGDDARVALGGAAGLIQANPVGLVLGAVAVGFLLGSLLPISAVEREQIGPIGEKLTDSAKAAASDFVDQGKAAVSQAVSDAFSGKSSKPSSTS